MVCGFVLARRGPFVLACRGLRGLFGTSGLIRFVGSGGRRRRAASAAPPEPPGDIADEQHRQRDEHVVGVEIYVVVDRGDVVAGEVAEADPGPHPQSGAEGVEGEETQPVHAGDAGDDPVRLAQALDEARERDDYGAAPVEELLGLVESLFGQEHVLAPPQGQGAATEVPDGKADIVADNGRDEGHDADGHDVEPARARVDGPGDQYRLAGHGNAEVLHHDQEADGPDAEVLQG